jgi:hypothetical protein
MKNKTVNYIVVRTETRVKNFKSDELARSWVVKQKGKDASNISKGRVEYTIWESPTTAEE